MIILFEYCVDVENYESFRCFGYIYIYIYRNYRLVKLKYNKVSKNKFVNIKLDYVYKILYIYIFVYKNIVIYLRLNCTSL